MADRCSVRGCPTVIIAGEENVHKLYRFPRDKYFNGKWKEVLKLSEVTPNDRVCGMHFRDSDFQQTNLGWKILVAGAVPSLNVEFPQDPLCERECKKEVDEVSIVSFKQENEASNNLQVSLNFDGTRNTPIDIASASSEDKLGEELILLSNSNVISDEVLPCKQQSEKIADQSPITKKQKLDSDSEPDSKRECYCCGAEFPDRFTLLMHINVIHSQPACKKCPKIFNSSEEYHNHVLKCSSSHGNKSSVHKPFFCNLCGCTFRLWSALKNHQKTKHAQSSSSHKCLTCNEIASSSSALMYHVETKHLKNRMICFECERVFKSMAEMWIHKSEYDHGYHLECPECCERFSSIPQLTVHFKSHPYVTFLCCEFCNIIFKSISFVKNHVLKHIASGANVIKCYFCSDGNQSHQSLQFQCHHHTYRSFSLPKIVTPVESQRQVKVELPCDTLSYSSATLPTAVISRNNCGNSKVELKCEDCDEVFGNETEKSLHLKIHQSRGDFCCMECGVQCNSFKALTTHYEDHLKSDEGGGGSWSSSDEDQG